MKKMTYVDALTNAINGNMTDETVERLTALRDGIVNRAKNRPHNPTKKQIETAEIAEKLFATMEHGVVYSGSEIQNLIPELNGATPQKIWAVTKALGDRVETSKVKGKVAYTLA